MVLARALAAVRGTPVQDQVIEAKRAWGIIAEGLAEEEARVFAEELRSAGVSCAVVPASALARLPEAEPATTWGDLPEAPPFLVAVAGMTVTETRTTKETKGPTGAKKIASAAIMIGTGLPIKVGGRQRSVERSQRSESIVFCADLHYEDSRRRLRIDASRFDFSCLGERMLYHAQGNLKLLVGDLVGGARDVLRNHGAEVLLEGKPIRTMGYGSLEDLDREERWLLTLRAMER
jgi:hypothetical protein